ncbi:unnamed protein product [Polarella glacialis]|uniref:Uncharacterized protein n=1 Tax=Polarella glacialis TaxID=89957 RepID=A0A813IWT2_POLGL|nr:unnamed protein product [Polarella glacialis]
MAARALSFTQAWTTPTVRRRETAEELPSYLTSPQVTPPPPAGGQVSPGAQTGTNRLPAKILELHGQQPGHVRKLPQDSMVRSRAAEARPAAARNCCLLAGPVKPTASAKTT